MFYHYRIICIIINFFIIIKTIFIIGKYFVLMKIYERTYQSNEGLHLALQRKLTTYANITTKQNVMCTKILLPPPLYTPIRYHFSRENFNGFVRFRHWSAALKSQKSPNRSGKRRRYHERPSVTTSTISWASELGISFCLSL